MNDFGWRVIGTLCLTFVTKSVAYLAGHDMAWWLAALIAAVLVFLGVALWIHAGVDE